jgi:hypothetical protein
MEESQFSVRRYGAKDSEVMKADDILAKMLEWNDFPLQPFKING